MTSELSSSYKSPARTALRWWLQVLISSVPWLIVINTLQPIKAPEWLPMAAFVLALSSLFLHIKLFNRFKHAVIQVGRDKANPTLWQQFLAVRQQALWLASVTAWLAVPAWLVGLESVPSALLVIASIMLLWLYRVPRQLW